MKRSVEIQVPLDDFAVLNKIGCEVFDCEAEVVSRKNP